MWRGGWAGQPWRALTSVPARLRRNWIPRWSCEDAGHMRGVATESRRADVGFCCRWLCPTKSGEAARIAADFLSSKDLPLQNATDTLQNAWGEIRRGADAENRDAANRILERFALFMRWLPPWSICRCPQDRRTTSSGTRLLPRCERWRTRLVAHAFPSEL